MFLKKVVSFSVAIAVVMGFFGAMSVTAASANVSNEIATVAVEPSGTEVKLSSVAAEFSKDLWSTARANAEGYSLPFTTDVSTSTLTTYVPVEDPAFLGSWAITVDGTPTSVTSASASQDGWHFTLVLGTTVSHGDIVTVAFTSDISVTNADSFFALCWRGNANCTPTVIADFTTTAANNVPAPANNAPVFGVGSLAPDVVTGTGGVVYTTSATDADVNDTLTYTLDAPSLSSGFTVSSAGVVSASSSVAAGDYSVTVTVSDGVATDTETVSITVAEVRTQSSDATATFTVDGQARISGATFTVPRGTPDVTVVVTPNDPNATFVISGATGLATGRNVVTVVVTAEDGTTTSTSTFNVWWAAPIPSTISVTPVPGGLNLAWTDSGQAFTFFTFATSIAGPFTYLPNNVCAGIPAGVTSCTVYGLSSASDYYYQLSTTASGSGAGFSGWSTSVGPFEPLAPLSDASATFTVNGISKVSGDTINVAAGVTSVTVVATPTDSNASSVVAGSTGLLEGTNTVSVVVTAQDGTTQITSTFTVVVATALETATAAVIAAEAAETQASVDTASTLVTALPDGAAKTALVARLAVVQAAIDAAAAAALAAARLAGISSLGAYVAAGGLSSNVLYTNLLSALFANPAVTANITSATSALNAATTALINLAAATNSVVAAEAAETQASVTSASTLVNALPAGAAKDALVARLAVVQAGIDAVNAAAALAAADAAVVVAETSVAQADVTSASALVTALPDGAAKTALVARLAVVQTAIDAANAAAALAAAIAAADAAVVVAETSVAQADVTSASALVTALPDGDAKTALVARLAVVQTAIDAATALAAAVTAATTAVVAAEAAVTQVSVTAALALVNALPAGVTKTALLARLAVVQAAVTAALTPPTPVNTVAGAPTAVSVTAGDSSASVSWNAPASNGGAAITNYQIEYSSDSGATWTVFVRTVSTLTSATVTGLVNGRSYTFRVKAVNAVGSSAASTASASVTPIAPVIEPVEKSISGRTTFSNNAVVLSAKQKAGLRAYFENYRNAKNLSIEVIGYANSRTSTRAAIAAATARAKAIVAFVKTLGIEATFTTKIVSKGTKNQAVFNLKWVE